MNHYSCFMEHESCCRNHGSCFRNHELCIRKHESCFRIHEWCSRNHESCSTNRGSRSMIRESCSRNRVSGSKNHVPRITIRVSGIMVICWKSSLFLSKKANNWLTRARVCWSASGQPPGDLEFKAVFLAVGIFCLWSQRSKKLKSVQRLRCGAMWTTSVHIAFPACSFRSDVVHIGFQASSFISDVVHIGFQACSFRSDVVRISSQACSIRLRCGPMDLDGFPMTSNGFGQGSNDIQWIWMDVQ